MKSVRRGPLDQLHLFNKGGSVPVGSLYTQPRRRSLASSLRHLLPSHSPQTPPTATGEELASRARRKSHKNAGALPQTSHRGRCRLTVPRRRSSLCSTLRRACTHSCQAERTSWRTAAWLDSLKTLQDAMRWLEEDVARCHRTPSFSFTFGCFLSLMVNNCLHQNVPLTLFKVSINKAACGSLSPSQNISYMMQKPGSTFAWSLWSDHAKPGIIFPSMKPDTRSLNHLWLISWVLFFFPKKIPWVIFFQVRFIIALNCKFF